jgi:hypothetical protein
VKESNGRHDNISEKFCQEKIANFAQKNLPVTELILN